ncbi:LANO_0E08526g1_1 [Lachancea nothofagi CBS 11611]|uniref:LANO_0E08526g1_1 n=1 Tax=Lachancea nothofagi CBS 11611 TaxID=1266666 RepID=A0A1G4JV36_9SACH|nr:LANO_0E08526g1_1 [Lachancea nothofagi CBS 11611]
MKYIAEVRLKGSTFVIIRQTLRELSGQHGCHCQATISNAIIRAVENKLRKMPLEPHNNNAMHVSSRSFLLEGQGSIEISSTPTEAQASIVRSLIKVVLHQIGTSGRYNLTEGQENLLVSLCVESLQIEPVAQKMSFQQACKSTAKEVLNVFESPDSSIMKAGEKSSLLTRKTFFINCYCCLEDYAAKPDFSNISEEFDKIDIQDVEDCADDDETLVAAHPLLSGISISQDTLAQSKIHLLPSSDYEGLWESLQFDDNIKQRLFSYATISLKLSRFSQQRVSQALVSNNKILLVHGPPGTGKTTVCKALCQKLAIRFNNQSHKVFQSDDYQAIMIELSCSRIFSRWFGESAKNLDKIFQDVENLLTNVSNKDRFVCLLMDEVETLASSRSSLMNKNETTDGIRVVNTLLTKLDSLKKYHNLLILATSNLVSSLDEAFLDRADGVFYAGNPSENGTSMILSSTISELIKTGVISCKEGISILEDTDVQESVRHIARRCVDAGVSGRTLRKLPLISLSEQLSSLPVTIRDFMLALAFTVKQKAHQTQDSISGRRTDA